MADSILRLKVESQEYDNKLKQAAQGLTRYVDQCRKVGGTLEVVEKETLDYVRALGQMDTTSRTATGNLAEMKKAFVELSAQYKQMTDAEKQSPFGKTLAASLDELKGRIGESKVQLDDINKSINGGGGLTGALDAVAGKFGLSIDQVTKFGGVVGLTTTAVQVCKDAFFNSESNIDEWGRTVKGAEGAYQVFLDTLNNGNWSNFFHNLSLAIQGGRDLYDVFDRLGSIKSNNAAAIAIVQQQIAQLRLAKQQGENVDAQLKAATDRLAQLQKQSINAGKTAGTTSAFQTIRNGVNSIGGAGVNDATIQYAVDRIMKGGQAEFDKYKRNYEVLQKRGTGMTTSYQTTAYGGTMAVQKREFNIANLTQEEQKQYALAKAITEGETRIQKGIAAYAQAVSEGTASAREQFKGNRYALQGAGGGGGGRSDGGGKGGSGKTTTATTYAAGSLAEAHADVQRLTKLWNEAGADVRDVYLRSLIDAESKLKQMKDEQALLKEQIQGRLLGDTQKITYTATVTADTQEALDKLREIEGVSIDPKTATVTADTQEALDKLREINGIHLDEKTIKVNVERKSVQTTGLEGVNFNGFAGTLPDLSKSLQLDNLPQFLSPLQQLNAELEQLRKNLEYAPTTEAYQEGLKAIADKQKEIASFKGIDLAKDADKSAKSFQAAAGAISQVGSALNGIEDPTAKILGIIAQAIASVAAGAGQAVSAKDTTSSGWAWIGAAAAITASMVAMISQIHSATGYAQGGIVDGRGGGFVGGMSYSGDNIGNVRLDSGELVLNRAQQTSLANQLQSSPMSQMQLSAVVTGEQIRLVLNNNGRRTGRGEYVTTNFT